MNLPLDKKFEQFMFSSNDFESIDVLMKKVPHEEIKRADYLAYDRSFIIEQKFLKIDVDVKIQEYINNLIKERGVIGCGRVSLRMIIETLPDSEKIKTELYNRISKGIDGILAKADKQIYETRTFFDLANSFGMVILLNENCQFLQPDLVAFKSFDMLRKLRDDSIRYPNIHCVLLISEAHRLIGERSHQLVPLYTIFSEEGAKSDVAQSLTDRFRRQWAAYCGSGYIEWLIEPRGVRSRDREETIRLER